VWRRGCEYPWEVLSAVGVTVTRPACRMSLGRLEQMALAYNHIR
jgi:hypothetical protein